jgi:hypothetical protein
MKTSIAALALLLGACATPSAPAAQVTTTTPTSTPQAGITVTGTGEVGGAPDTLTLDLGVSVLRPSVDQATGDAAALAQAVIEALRQGGVGEADITTTNYSIFPEYDYRNDTQQLRGYRVTNTVRAKIRDLERAGELIDAATAAGGDDVVVQGIAFSIEEDGELVTAAREEAWKDARGKAEQLAGLAGRSLGPAISITETIATMPPIILGRVEAADTATPIEPGTQQVSVTISVVFSFAD